MLSVDVTNYRNSEIKLDLIVIIAYMTIATTNDVSLEFSTTKLKGAANGGLFKHIRRPRSVG